MHMIDKILDPRLRDFFSTKRVANALIINMAPKITQPI